MIQEIKADSTKAKDLVKVIWPTDVLVNRHLTQRHLVDRYLIDFFMLRYHFHIMSQKFERVLLLTTNFKNCESEGENLKK
jgi:hypothetical protein